MTANVAFLDAVAALVCNESKRSLDQFIDALKNGGLETSSTSSALQDRLRLTNPRLQRYASVLSEAPDRDALLLALQASLHTAAQDRTKHVDVELAWTYPDDPGLGWRTTARVSKEIIESSCESLLVIGYMVTVDDDLSGLAAQTIAAMADAARRGVQATIALQQGSSNRENFLRAWGDTVPPPPIYTWPGAADRWAKVHAKVIVSDRTRALVTSANLTYHGFRGNLEMGLSVKGGGVPQKIDTKIRELIQKRDLVLWRD